MIDEGFEQTKMRARATYAGVSLRDLAMHMKSTREEKERIEADLSRVNAIYDVLRYEAIPQKMDEEGMEKGPTFEGIGRISLTADMFVSTTDKEGLFGWLEDNGLADIIQPTVNPSTLKAFIKGRMKGGKEVPSDYVSVSPVTRASITKT